MDILKAREAVREGLEAVKVWSDVNAEDVTVYADLTDAGLIAAMTLCLSVIGNPKHPMHHTVARDIAALKLGALLGLYLGRNP